MQIAEPAMQGFGRSLWIHWLWLNSILPTGESCLKVVQPTFTLPSCSNKGCPSPIYEADTRACSGAEYNTTSFLTTNVYQPEPVDPALSCDVTLQNITQNVTEQCYCPLSCLVHFRPWSAVSQCNAKRLHDHRWCVQGLGFRLLDC